MSSMFRSSVPALPPLPKVPPTAAGNNPDINDAARRERARHRAQGRESTVLGGTTTLAEPFVKTLLGG